MPMDQKRKPAGAAYQAQDQQPNPIPAVQTENALVLFGGTMEMLPKELEELGLAGKVIAQEIPGVPPNWKPVNNGDYLLGRCVAEREKLFDQGTKKERISKVLVFQTAVPGGFRSVWLGADLEIKLQNPIGKVFQISYQGEVQTSLGLNPMKSYQVFEIMPKQITEG